MRRIQMLQLSKPQLWQRIGNLWASALLHLSGKLYRLTLKLKQLAKGEFCYSSVPNSSACTFINFEKKIHPARSYLGLHVYWFWQNFPPCTFITPCTFIGLYYKFFTVVTFLQAKQSKQSYNGYLLTFILQSLKYFSCQIIFHYIFVICTQNYAPLLIFWK